jgi:alpha-1,2-mannosyltransferase
VEPWTFYFKNAFLNFNIAAPLAGLGALRWGYALARTLLDVATGKAGGGKAAGKDGKDGKGKGGAGADTDADGNASAARARDALFLAPMVLWFALLTSRPHKEERFLFPVYPLVCLAAAWAVHFCTQLLQAAAERTPLGANLRATGAAKALLVGALLGGGALLSGSRSFAIVRNYGAPLQVRATAPTTAPAALAARRCK